MLRESECPNNRDPQPPRYGHRSSALSKNGLEPAARYLRTVAVSRHPTKDKLEPELSLNRGLLLAPHTTRATEHAVLYTLFQPRVPSDRLLLCLIDAQRLPNQDAGPTS